MNSEQNLHNTAQDKTGDNKPPEKVEDLKKQTTDTDEVKKGYNEKNPVQEQGAFKPDNSEPDN